MLLKSILKVIWNRILPGGPGLVGPPGPGGPKISSSGHKNAVCLKNSTYLVVLEDKNAECKICLFKLIKQA